MPDWRRTRSEGGGVLLDLASHHVDLLRFFLRQEIREIDAELESYSSDHDLEDRELCDRLLHHGYRMIYTAEALVYHAHDLTFGSFLGQHFRYGRGAFCFHQIRARRGQHRFKVEPPGFYFNMLRYPFVNAKGVKALLLMLLLVVTQVANAAGFLWEGTSGKGGMTT